jgi:hypothetical protein
LRRTSDPEPTTAVETDVAERTDRAVQKGRPTPKRRDVAPRRQPLSAPRTNKEASQWRKQQVAQGRAPSTKLSNAELREARLRGDARALPRKDQGPARQYARNWVDTHRMGTNYLLIIFPIYLVGITYKPLSIAAAAILLVLLIECYFTARIVRRQIIERLGSAKDSDLALAFYILGRAYMPRRMRVPKPVLNIGDPIPK